MTNHNLTATDFFTEEDEQHNYTNQEEEIDGNTVNGGEYEETPYEGRDQLH